MISITVSRQRYRIAALAKRMRNPKWVIWDERVGQFAIVRQWATTTRHGMGDYIEEARELNNKKGMK